MLRSTLVFLRDTQMRKTTHSQRYYRKMRAVYRSEKHKPNFIPVAQAAKAREDHISLVMEKKGINAADPKNRAYAESAMYGTRNRGRMIEAAGKRTRMMEGLGDDESLTRAIKDSRSNSERFSAELTEPTYAEKGPETFGRLLSRRLQTGQLWPTAPKQQPPKQLKRLGNAGSSTPSSTNFCRKIEYVLRRNLKAMPSHIAEQIDFTQLIIDRVFGSNRSNNVTIVWSTVDPGYRHVVEPHLQSISTWARNQVVKYIPWTVAIPRIHWAYNSGTIPEAWPRKLLKELRDSEQVAVESIEDRVEKLKALDSLEHRMRHIPWFMPYLWSKDKRSARESRMRSDLAEVQNRKQERNDGAEFVKDPGYVR